MTVILRIRQTALKPRRKSRKKVDPDLIQKKWRPPPFKELKRPEPARLNNTDHIPSLLSATPDPNLFVERVTYEGEMAKREAAAQAEIERKKTMVAPICNKGGYQYVGDAPKEVVQTLGRKV